MGSEINSDKLNIKNILFTKALPNYTIPVPTNGYKFFPCTECGDKFLFESSYNDHINRKSLNITYYCRYCNKLIISKNRCRLLSHIRSHAFKTTTINVSDLKIDPLPIQDINWTLPPPNNSQIEIQKSNTDSKACYECKINISESDNINKDRAAHYMKYSNTLFSCPVCLFLLPSVCALKAHLRVHLKVPPYFCPECGTNLPAKSISYPYNHDCEGFNMIRATTRLICKKKRCQEVFHPNDSRVHVSSHLKKVFKCLTCSQVWSSKPSKKHFECNSNDKIVCCFQCQLCSNALLFKNELNRHLQSHFNFNRYTEEFNEHVYPCMSCNLSFDKVPQLIKHHVNKHASNKMQNILIKILNEYNKPTDELKFYNVHKKCDKCLRSYLCRWDYENRKYIPNECPYKCSSTMDIHESNETLQIVCYLCKNKVKENWGDIKDHFATFHKNYKCLDLKLKLTKIDNIIRHTNKKPENTNLVKKSIVKNNTHTRKSELHSKRKNEMVQNKVIEINDTSIDEMVCNICHLHCENKQSFESHIISHRDPCMAYQCLECGQSFVVKPSFSTHLLLKHGIADVNEYINKKQCYNESALLKQPNNNTKLNDEPIKENQCKICRDEFDNSIDLEKHFRVHGMAFLMKNTNKNSSP